MPLSSIPALIDELRSNRMIILMDDEDRENEGDLLIAAEAVTPEVIHFFSSQACGLICMPITEERSRQLKLPMMASNNRSQHETNFTVSIDATEQIGPGISAIQRAHTVAKAVKRNAKPTDIEQPGHIFPLVAKPGGVLRRAGHTEAGVDLAKMAGFQPAALIVEIMNEDGSMARRPELEIFAEQHKLKMGTIADLIEYRTLHEQSVELSISKKIDTDFGSFLLHVFHDLIDSSLHYVLVRGDIDKNSEPLVRVQTIDPLRDVIGTLIDNSSSGWSYRRSMEHIAKNGCGVVVLIGQPSDTKTEFAAVESFPEASLLASDAQNYRVIGTGAQILRTLGITKMRLLSEPKRFNALSGFNLEITGFESLG
tara:strand:+ start:895 stop:1998 length:1104 start_codon:yes stop_codon:yes gene_type:complete